VTLQKTTEPLPDTTPPLGLPLIVRVGWGTGTFAMSLMFQAVSLLVLRYLVDYVGVAAALAGTLIGLAKAYDAVTDPVMGTLSDRTKTRWGRRRPYLVLGGIISAVSFILLFNLAAFTDYGSSELVAIVAFALLLNATGYTIFNVPYLAMPAEMTNDYIDRTKLISFRAGAVALGGIVATAIGPAIISTFGGGVEGHAAMSYFLAAIILGGGLLCFLTTARAPALMHTSLGGIGFRKQLRTAIGNRPFLLLLGVKVCHLTGLAIYLSTMPFFFNVILQRSLSYMGLYFLVQSTFILISQFLWVRITRDFGKNAAYYLAVLFYVGALLSWLLADSGEPVALILCRAMFTGIGAGGVLLIGQSLLPDTMQYDYQRTGIRREGIFAGVYTTVEKLSFALGPSLMGLLLGTAGYVAGGGERVAQSQASEWVIYAGASILPAVGITAAGLVMTRYKLNEAMLTMTRPDRPNTGRTETFRG